MRENKRPCVRGWIGYPITFYHGSGEQDAILLFGSIEC